MSNSENVSNADNQPASRETITHSQIYPPVSCILCNAIIENSNTIHLCSIRSTEKNDKQNIFIYNFNKMSSEFPIR